MVKLQLNDDLQFTLFTPKVFLHYLTRKGQKVFVVAMLTHLEKYLIVG